jgi:hypothetical protein
MKEETKKKLLSLLSLTFAIGFALSLAGESMNSACLKNIRLRQKTSIREH